jgi:hypothetical protein
MRGFITLLGAVAAATLSVVGCGSDSVTPAGSAGATGDVQCHGDYSVLKQSQFDALVDSSGKCAGASDRTALCAQDITTLAEQCGGGCFQSAASDDAAQATCVAVCINHGASLALSVACVDCYVADVACARDNCALQCGLAPTSATCAACRVDAHCAPDFFACSGLPGQSSEPGAGGAGGDNSQAGAAGN